MCNQALISIVIPTFNRANFIEETLKSIQNQTYTYWECIVVDDGSDDNTDEVVNDLIKTDSRIKYYQRPKSLIKGANTCRNYGYQKSEGKYIKWFDSDDIMLPTALETQIKHIQESKKSIIISEFNLFKNGGIRLNTPQCSYADVTDIFLEYISGNLTLNTQIILFERTIVDKFLFDEDLSRCQDMDFIYRILRENREGVFINDEVLFQIRAHSDSITGGYHKGDYKSIQSDLKVRKMILDQTINDNSLSYKIKGNTLTNYLDSIRALLINNYKQEYFLRLNYLKKNLSLYQSLKIEMLKVLAVVYICTKRGLYIYGKFSKSI